MPKQTIDQTSAQEALEQLGVSADLLTDEERDQLDEEGYLVLDGILSRDQLQSIRTRLSELVQAERRELEQVSVLRKRAEARVGYIETFLAEGSHRFDAPMTAAWEAKSAALRTALEDGDLIALGQAMEDPGIEPGVDFLDDLLHTDPDFFDVLLGVLTSPKILAAVTHVLGPEIHLPFVVSRAPYIGGGYQKLHQDTMRQDDKFTWCSVYYLIDDMTIENGATRVVPRSHHNKDFLQEFDGGSSTTHPDEIRIEGPAGGLVIFNGSLWHGGMPRTGGGQRRLLFAAFTTRPESDGENASRTNESTVVDPMAIEPAQLRPELDARLSEPQRWLLAGYRPTIARE